MRDSHALQRVLDLPGVAAVRTNDGDPRTPGERAQPRHDLVGRWLDEEPVHLPARAEGFLSLRDVEESRRDDRKAIDEVRSQSREVLDEGRSRPDARGIEDLARVELRFHQAALEEENRDVRGSSPKHLGPQIREARAFLCRHAKAIGFEEHAVDQRLDPLALIWSLPGTIR